MSSETATKKRTRRPRANSKSGAVWAFLQRHPEAGPTEISKALKKKGIDISPAHVSNVKATLKKAEGGEAAVAANGKKRGRRGRRPGRAGGADTVSLAGLLEARQFVDSVGGVEKASELIDALAKLR